MKLPGVIAAVTFALLICHALFAAPPEVNDPVLYVALDGSDAWSGTLAAPNRRKTDGPFATIGRAQQAARADVQQDNRAGHTVTISVRGGVYPLADTLTFSGQDTGTAAGTSI